MFYTGHTSSDALSVWPRAPALNKPAEDSTMAKTIVRLLA